MARQYDKEYKVQAVLLAKKIGAKRAAAELSIPEGTLYDWVKASKNGRISLGAGNTDASDANTIADELIQCRNELKRLQKEVKKLKEENEILADAAAFFAKSRLNRK